MLTNWLDFLIGIACGASIYWAGYLTGKAAAYRSLQSKMTKISQLAGKALDQAEELSKQLNQERDVALAKAVYEMHGKRPVDVN